MASQGTRVPLQGGAYTARDVIADAQQCVNLYGEKNPEDAPVPMTYYPTPGLQIIASESLSACRCLYTSGRGLVFGVFGPDVVQITATGILLIGQIGAATTPVRMQDNGLVLVIVDGSNANSSGLGGGWYVTLTSLGAPSGGVVAINDPAWQGSTTIAILDTFLVFNVPGANTFYLSPSNYTGNATPFDALYIASKTTYADSVRAVVSVGALVWIMGSQTTEVWFDAGASDFPFQRTEGVLIPYGTIAPYSVATIAGTVFWLASDAHGRAVVMAGAQYQGERISTHALEYVWNTYADLTAAIGSTYQQDGHAFYCITFPTSDTTWVWDAIAGEWHQRASADAAGLQHRWRCQWLAHLGTTGVIGAGLNDGNVYALEQSLGTDAGTPITRIRSFPHLMSSGSRAIYRRLAVDLDTYNDAQASFTVAWSTDRGETFTPQITVAVDGHAVDFPSVWRLGMSRDRIFAIQWTDPNISALNGAFVWVDAAAT